MADMKHPRASIWLIEVTDQLHREVKIGELGSVLERAKQLLRTRLGGTHLHLVGKPVIEEDDEISGIRVSWKVFSGPYPSEENDYA